MDTYIAEIAGKDSIAAVLSFAKAHKKINIIPTVVLTGTEYGDLKSYDKTIYFLKDTLKYYDVTIKDTVYLQDGSFWNLLNAKYQYSLFKRFGIYAPCITCHMYTHLIRIPVYKKYNAKGIITGERISHSGKIKLNQHYLTISAFDEIFMNSEINMERPLLLIEDVDVIDQLIDNEEILRHTNDVKCVMSGNLSEFILENSNNTHLLKKYLKEYVIPVGLFCVEQYLYSSKLHKEEIEDIIKEILYV